MTEEGQFSGRSTHVSRFQKLVDDETTRVQSSLMSQRREMWTKETKNRERFSKVLSNPVTKTSQTEEPCAAAEAYKVTLASVNAAEGFIKSVDHLDSTLATLQPKGNFAHRWNEDAKKLEDIMVHQMNKAARHIKGVLGVKEHGQNEILDEPKASCGDDLWDEYAGGDGTERGSRQGNRGHGESWAAVAERNGRIVQRLVKHLPHN